MDSKLHPLPARSTPLWAAAFAMLTMAAVVPSVQAQGTGGSGSTAVTAGSYSITLLTIDGKAPGIMKPLIGVEQCQRGAPIEFQLTGVPMSKSLDIWVGEGCTNTSSRSGIATPGVTPCIRVTTLDPQTTSDIKLQVQLKASLFTEQCKGSSEQVPNIWFLAVGSIDPPEAVTTNYAEYTGITFDMNPPGVPTEVTGGDGERQIPVTWKNNLTGVQKFIVYIDPTPSTGPTSGSQGGQSGAAASGAGTPSTTDSGTSLGDAGTASTTDAGTAPITTPIGPTNTDCGTGLLLEGAAAPPRDALPAGLMAKEFVGATISSAQLSGADIGPIGSSAAVSVVAVDLAGNQSVLSKVVCVNVVKTSGFWDSYTMNGGTADTGCPCAALGPAHAESAWPIALSLGMVALSARRRRPL